MIEDKYTVINAYGVKERAIMAYFVANPSITEIVYAGPACRYTQVLLAKACKVHNKKFTIFTPPVTPEPWLQTPPINNHITAKICYPSTTIHEFENMSDTITAADQYIRSETAPRTVLWSDQHIPYLAKLVKMPDMQRCWVMFGTGVLLKALIIANPQAKFLCVANKHQINQTKYADSWSQIIPYYGYPPTPRPMPYSSNPYEEKLWVYVAQSGQLGDYIWNAT